jgi:phosphoribosyl 1,2-cyclic phosphate phosphodiesterase
MPRPPVTADIRGQLVLLGTGTSVGVPVIGCGCPTCTSGDPRNRRTRCSLVLGAPEGNLLVDTTPDLRQQLLREKIGLVHAVLYTHAHADHLFGLDDVRMFPYYLGHRLPIYCEPDVERRIRQSFDYCFAEGSEAISAGGIPQLEPRRLTTAPLSVLGQRVVPIRLKHGGLDVLGFRWGRIAYCTDVSAIPDESWTLLEGLDVLILDALRFRPHPTHFSLDEAVAAAQRIGAKRTCFTHVSHDLEHAAVNDRLPPGMELAYDGMRFPLEATGLVATGVALTEGGSPLSDGG